MPESLYESPEIPRPRVAIELTAPGGQIALEPMRRMARSLGFVVAPGGCPSGALFCCVVASVLQTATLLLLVILLSIVFSSMALTTTYRRRLAGIYFIMLELWLQH